MCAAQIAKVFGGQVPARRDFVACYGDFSKHLPHNNTTHPRHKNLLKRLAEPVESLLKRPDSGVQLLRIAENRAGTFVRARCAFSANTEKVHARWFPDSVNSPIALNAGRYFINFV